MITALTGSNSFLLRRRLNELIEGFVRKHGDLAVERIDADEADAQGIIDSIQSLPFLATKKMVVVRGLGTNKLAAEQVEQIISATSPSTELVLYEPVTDRRTVYFKTLRSKTNLENFEPMDRQGLAKWLVEETKNKKGSLSIADANYLVERVGDNQQLLANELDKLLICEPLISRQTIDLLTEPTPQGRIFDLLDASFGGNKSRALQLYEEQRAQKVEPQAILALIAWQLQMIILAKYGKNRTPDNIAKDAGVNPYPIIKAARLAKDISETKLKKMVSEAFRIDVKSKTSGLDLDEALKTYIVTL